MRLKCHSLVIPNVITFTQGKTRRKLNDCNSFEIMVDHNAYRSECRLMSLTRIGDFEHYISIG